MKALKGNKYQGLLDMMLGGKAPKYGNNGLYSSSVDVNFDLPETEPTRREKRWQEREDKKGMIPARFRNRGQEGLDAYRDMMARRRKRGKKSNMQKLADALRLGFLVRKSEEISRSQASGAGSGCEKDGSCGALGKQQ